MSSLIRFHQKLAIHIVADDRRAKHSGGPVQGTSHHHWRAQRLARSQREDPATATPVRRVLQIRQPAPPAADTQVPWQPHLGYS